MIKLLIASCAVVGGIVITLNKQPTDYPGVLANRAHVVLSTSKGVWLADNKPFTGTLFELSDQGDTLSVSSYYRGREHGQWKTFYNNRQLQTVRYYDHGKKTGCLQRWHDNGQLAVTANFIDDEYDGVLKEWDSQGNLLKALTYARGHESGAQRAWYPNGKIRSNYVVIEGRRYGLLGTKHCINVSDNVTLAR